MYIVKIHDYNGIKIRSGKVDVKFQSLPIICDDSKSIN